MIGADVALIQSRIAFFGASSRRGRDIELELEALGGMRPGSEHVVVVAGPGHGLALDRAAVLLEGHESAITWQGCERRVRPLMTGTVAYCASSSSAS